MRDGLFTYRDADIKCDMRDDYFLIDDIFLMMIVRRANLKAGHFAAAIDKELGDYLQSIVPDDVWLHLADGSQWIEAKHLNRFIGAVVENKRTDLLHPGPWQTGEFKGDDLSYCT